MKVSILTANYNHGRFLECNLEGVLAQIHSDWELIIVDDGSTDDSASIIRKYAARDHRIKPIYFPSNRGAMPAIHAAYQAATGDLLFGCAADDYICHPAFFEMAVTALKSFPTAAGFFARASVVDPETLAEKWVMGDAPSEGFCPPRDALFAFLQSRLWVPGVRPFGNAIYSINMEALTRPWVLNATSTLTTRYPRLRAWFSRMPLLRDPGFFLPVTAVRLKIPSSFFVMLSLKTNSGRLS